MNVKSLQGVRPLQKLFFERREGREAHGLPIVIMKIVKIPVLTKEAPEERILEFFKKIGWNPNTQNINPIRVMVHCKDWVKIVDEEMSRVAQEDRAEVNSLWMSYGPSGRGASPGKVELYSGWVVDSPIPETV